jgi:hypothetical protein
VIERHLQHALLAAAAEGALLDPDVLTVARDALER